MQEEIEKRFEDILKNHFNRKESKYGVFYKSKLVNLNGGVSAYKSYNLARANIISIFGNDNRADYALTIDKMIEDKIIEIKELH